MDRIESKRDRIAREMRRSARERRISRMQRESKVWPSERRMLLPKPPAWVADRDLWEKISKKVGGYGRGYGWSLTEATRLYREEGGAIRRAPARFDEYKKASILRRARMGRLRLRQAKDDDIERELYSFSGPEEIAHGLDISAEAGECIFEAIAKIPKARIERAQRKYEKRMKGE